MNITPEMLEKSKIKKNFTSEDAEWVKSVLSGNTGRSSAVLLPTTEQKLILFGDYLRFIASLPRDKRVKVTREDYAKAIQMKYLNDKGKPFCIATITGWLTTARKEMKERGEDEMVVMIKYV